MAEALILTGFMGSGKTAVGKLLAEKLNRDFFDADPLVEERMGMPIPEIFEIHGEPEFRKAEETVVTGLLGEAAKSSRGAVISLGGGAVTIAAIYEKLVREPLVVLLDEDVDRAWQHARGGSRPLAADPEHFRSLYAERESIYRSVAKYIVDTRDLDAGGVADRIVELIHERTGTL
ncbi:MAG: shikimate kinase [Thermoleophilia bacterium]